MSSLREKTVKGIFWSSIQNIGAKGIDLVIIVLLARLIDPEAFGLIGMLSIFIHLSQVFMQAGFKEALIQRKDVNESDYSSVFFINLCTGVLIYLSLFFLSPLISEFYGQPILVDLTRVLSLIFIINAFSYVQEAKLAREMRFKTLTIVQIPSTVISGVVAVTMALTGFGVWSIIGLQVVMRFVYAVQIWIYSDWQPNWTFNSHRAKTLFSYGSKLLISSLIQSVYQNIYSIVIGKYFPLASLGYYQNAQKLVDLPTRTLSMVMKNVTFPAFSMIQDDDDRLKMGYRKTIEQLMFWLCPTLILLAVLAEPLFAFILTDKWLPAVPFFQILCVTGVFYPLNNFNLNIVSVKGRSDIVLRLQIIKKIIVVVGLIVTIPIGIWALITFQAINSLFSYILNSVYSGRFISYSISEQVKDCLPVFVISGCSGLIAYIIAFQLGLDFPNWLRLTLGLCGGGISYGIIAWQRKISPVLDFLNIIESWKGK